MSTGKITRFQNNIRIDGDLDLSNSTGYLTLSSLSSAPSSPTVGDQYYDSTLGKARIYQATGWSGMDGTAAGSLDAAYNGGATIAVDGGAVTLTDSQTNTAGGLLITKSGIVASSSSNSIFHINSTATHTSTGTMKMIELSCAADSGSQTQIGIEMAMPAHGDSGITITKGSQTITDGDFTVSGCGASTSSGFTVTTANTSGDGVEFNLDSITSGDAFIINCTTDATNYLAIQTDNANIFTINGTDVLSGLPVEIDVDDADAFLVTEAGNTEVFSIDTTQDAGDTTFSMTTATTTGIGVNIVGATTTGNVVEINADYATTGNALLIAVTSATMGATGAAISVIDTTNADREVFAVRDDGSVYMYGTAEGTTATQSVTGDMLISDGDLTVSGGEVSFTDGVTTAGSGLLLTSSMTTAGAATGTAGALTILANSATTGTILSVVANAVTSGDMLYLDNGGGTLSGGFYINCNDDNLSDFTVGNYGATVITGSASGTAALTLTAGDITLTSGSIAMTDTNSDQFAILYDASNHLGIDVDVDGSTTLTTTGTNADFEIASGTTGDITLDSTLDIIMEAGGADITMDAQLTITNAAQEAGLVITNNAQTTADGVDISSTSITTGALMKLNANGVTHDGEVLEIISAGDATSTAIGLSVTMSAVAASTGADAAHGIWVDLPEATSGANGIQVRMDKVTTADMLKLDAGGGTMTGAGRYINCVDDAAAKFTVAGDGTTTIAGTAAGTASLTMALGDLVITDSDASTITSVNGTTDLLTLTNTGGAVASGEAVLKVEAGGTVDAAGYGIYASFTGTAAAGATVVGIVPDAGSLGIKINAGGVVTQEALYVDADPTAHSVAYFHSDAILAADKAIIEVHHDTGASNGDSALIRVHQDHTTGASFCIQLVQDDLDVPFINFEGTSSADENSPISSLGTGTVTDYVRCAINGAKAWVPVVTGSLS